jgi:hypothetical protein
MEHRRVEVPDSAACAPCDERAAPRFTLLIRSAKLITPLGEFICVIRDVSETGISLRGFHALPVEGPLMLELGTGERHAIEWVWERGSEGGYRFIDPVEVHDLVAEAGRFPKRQLRLNIPLPIELAFSGRRARAEIVNLSQQGARVTSAELLAIDQPLRLLTATLPEIRARVRWRRDSEFGLVFDDTFSLAQLARFAAAVQQPALLAEPICATDQRR